MKNALILFKKAQDIFDARLVKEVTDILKNGGVFVDNLEVLQNDDLHNFKNRLEEYKNSADNIIQSKFRRTK